MTAHTEDSPMTDRTETGAEPAPVCGEAVFMRIFDLGGTVDVKKIRDQLGPEAEAPAVSALRSAPEYVSFATPIQLNLAGLNLNLSTDDGTAVTVAARLYPVGGLAISVRLAVREQRLAALNRYPELRYRLNGQTVDRPQVYKTIFEAFFPKIKLAYDEVFDEPVEPERYRAFCLTEVPGGAERLFTENRAQVAALLVDDPNPEKLSPDQIEEVTKRWFNYYRDDLVVVDWDAAFVVEPAAKYEDLLYVFEVANLELMLMRKYDQYLDRVLNRGYDEYERLLKGNPFFKRSAKNVLSELSDVRMDLAEVTDELENVVKFFGDYYVARIYMGLSAKLHLPDYHKTVDEKLATLNDLYRSVVDYLEARQNLFLEWAIVWLIVFEIVWAFFQH
jgi:hypothetical protein